MKVTFLAPNLELHGGNLVLKQYANFLSQKGCQVTVIASGRASDKLGLDEKIRLKTYKKFPIKLVDFFLFQLVYFRKISRLIKDCDVIIPVYTPLLLPAIWAKKRKKLNAKIVLLFQDFFEMIWAGPIIRFVLSRNCINRHIDCTIAVSNPIAKEFFKVTKKRAAVVTNGIEHEFFYKRHLTKENYLLFVGRPQKPKGFPIFKAAFKIIHKNFPSINAKVIAPGLTSKIENGIEYVPYKNKEQLATLYNKALIYINTSPGESFGLPALEAFASGTAVILTNTVGSREYAKNNFNCLVVPLGKPRAIFEAVKNIIKSPAKRALIELEAISTAQKYQWPSSQIKFEQQLKQVLGKNSI